ncbi:MFS transporter [Marinifilum sp. RC60d5]|uniref:MFS transporter n=1 Tax=Marinifilum sp. RC60d5 TaxID=3458414 RepID=UPI0040361D27
MPIAENISKHNFKSFLWHAVFLAFAQNFMDVDTVIPAMVIESGGNSFHVGIMAAIMMGGSSFTQLFFAPVLSNMPFKKRYLLGGINLRIVSLFSLAFILYIFATNSTVSILWILFLLISIFSFSGAFTNISYIDILGKSISESKRKSFFSTRQIVGGIIILSTAFLAKQVLSSSSFPMNYSIMFLIGGASLLFASFGFWNIKEIEPSGTKISGLKNFIHNMTYELKNNKKLIYFLGFINTQGIVISFIPFVMLYAKETFHTQASDTGLFLLFKVIGVVSMSLIVLVYSKRLKYNALLYVNAIISITLAMMILFIPNAAWLKWVFILGGFAVSLYMITLNGVLLEISGNENRALYTGLVGAGNIIPTIFPLISGSVISKFGYPFFYILFILIVSTSFFFIYKLRCKK